MATVKARRPGALMGRVFGNEPKIPEVIEMPASLDLHVTMDDVFRFRAGNLFGRSTGLDLGELAVKMRGLETDLTGVELAKPEKKKHLAITDIDETFHFLSLVMGITHADVFDDPYTQNALDEAASAAGDVEFDKKDVVNYINTFMAEQPPDQDPDNHIIVANPLMKTDLFMGAMALSLYDDLHHNGEYQRQVTNPLQTLAIWAIVNEMNDELA